jgi:hypothetical protein
MTRSGGPTLDPARASAAFGGLAFVLASCVLGVRLLLLATRTRRLPEVCIGLAQLLMGGLAYPLIMTARLAVRLSAPVRIGVMAVSILFMGVGTLAVGIFNWQVFRPGARWARGLVIAAAVSMLACVALQLAGPGLAAAAFDNRGLGFRLFQLHAGLLTAWGAYEALRAWWRLRRRQRLGLADPVVCERVFLWGIASVASTIVGGTSTIAGFLGINFAATVFGAAVIAPLGLLAAGSLWLAFLPPSAYLRRVRARALPTAARSAA